MKNELIENINKVHTTEMGVDRIRRNLGLGDIDVVVWCKLRILDKNADITRQGKNWYVRNESDWEVRREHAKAGSGSKSDGRKEVFIECVR